MTAPSARCSGSIEIVDEGQPSSGYLSSYVTSETGKGTPDCPWVITAREGQIINVTLLDFKLKDFSTVRALDVL